MTKQSKWKNMDRNFAINRILWPTDGSEQSYVALRVAVDMSMQYECELYAIQVVPPVPVMARGMSFPSPSEHLFDVRLYEAELMKMTEQKMKKIIESEIKGDMYCELKVLTGEPEDMICSFAKEIDADVIVMSTNGRTGVSHFMLGSVAEKTIRMSSKPVLVIPSRDPDDHERENATI